MALKWRRAGKPSLKVTHIMLEAINREPFVLRAEITGHAAGFQPPRFGPGRETSAQQPRAHWLRCRVLASCGEYDKAMDAGAEAVRLEPRNEHYLVTRRGAGAGRAAEEAAEEAHKAVELSTQRPHVKAREVPVGRPGGLRFRAEYRQAMQYHFQAVQIATPWSTTSIRPSASLPRR